jgi:hypothetical protein
MKVHVIRMNGQEFDVDIAEGMTVLEAKEQIKKLQDYSEPVGSLQLVLGCEVLKNSSTLTATVKDGDTLTLIKRRSWPMTDLLVNIYDDTQWHGKHKFALRSKPLGGEVEKIEVTVADFQDQGWGGCQARLFIYLYDEEDKVVASKLIFGPLRTAAYDERKHRRSPSCTLDAEEQVVAMARAGMFYRLKYQCGGGGGHSITVKDWRCKVVPKVVDEDMPIAKVISTVNLRNTSRLGADRTTGLWELQEPIPVAPVCGDFKDDDENEYSFTLEDNGNLLLTSCRKNMTGALTSNDDAFEGDITCDGKQLRVRLNGTADGENATKRRRCNDKIAFEWREGKATAWSQKILHRHFEGLINPDEQARTYSSVYSDNGKGTGHARSMLNSPQAWSAKHNADGEWMQIDLAEEKCIRGVVVQGRFGAYMQAVTQFSVSHSIDGVAFEEVEQTFQYPKQNFDESEAIIFACGPVKARYIKFTVQKWESHASMRAAVLEEVTGEAESDGQSEMKTSSSGY